MEIKLPVLFLPTESPQALAAEICHISRFIVAFNSVFQIEGEFHHRALGLIMPTHNSSLPIIGDEMVSGKDPFVTHVPANHHLLREEI